MASACCESWFFGAAPFEERTYPGVALAVTKRALIGLIVATALAAGIYFLKMAIYSGLGFDMSAGWPMGLSITSACIVGGIALLCPIAGVSLALEKLKKKNQADSTPPV